MTYLSLGVDEECLPVCECSEDGNLQSRSIRISNLRSTCNANSARARPAASTCAEGMQSYGIKVGPKGEAPTLGCHNNIVISAVSTLRPAL